MSLDMNDLPDLVDVSAEPTDQLPSKMSETADIQQKEEEFRPVMSKRKRRQMKMETEGANGKTIADGDESNEDELDMEEIEEILEEKPEDDQPLKKIRFPPISSEKLSVRLFIKQAI